MKNFLITGSAGFIGFHTCLKIKFTNSIFKNILNYNLILPCYFDENYLAEKKIKLKNKNE